MSLPSLKVLQIGAGSMGSRRLRDLHQHPDVTVALYDERADRRSRALDRFGVKVFATLEEALGWNPGAFVISTPPGTKGTFISLALERGLHHFSEADIWTYGAAQIERISREKGLVSAPSVSFAFLPLVQALGPLLREHLGPLLTYQFFMATYMPGWHAGEGDEYYARHRKTAPAREMIPFELQWLNSVFGPAAEVAGRYEKYGRLPGRTEDTWSLSMHLRDGGVGQLAITMACPVDYRRGCCFGTNGMATWDIYGGDVALHVAGESAPRRLNFGAMASVLEASYRDEIGRFVDAVLGRGRWPQGYGQSQVASATLAAAELSCVTGRWAPVDPGAEPQDVLPARA